MDLVRNLFPENIIQACLEKVQTVLKYPGPTAENATIQEYDKNTWKFEERWSSGSNILGLIVASLVRNPENLRLELCALAGGAWCNG